MSGQYKVAWLCEALLVSRSGYYDWKERRGESALLTHPRDCAGRFVGDGGLSVSRHVLSAKSAK
jgi:hypothetical protein